MNTKVFLKYYYENLFCNIAVSTILTISVCSNSMGNIDFKSPDIKSTSSALISIFGFSFLLLGFFAAILIYNYSNKKEIYFYYNLSFSKKKLYSLTFALNIVVFFCGLYLSTFLRFIDV